MPTLLKKKEKIFLCVSWRVGSITKMATKKNGEVSGNNTGRVFTGWNMRSDDDRVDTGSAWTLLLLSPLFNSPRTVSSMTHANGWVTSHSRDVAFPKIHRRKGVWRNHLETATGTKQRTALLMKTMSNVTEE